MSGVVIIIIININNELVQSVNVVVCYKRTTLFLVNKFASKLTFNRFTFDPSCSSLFKVFYFFNCICGLMRFQLLLLRKQCHFLVLLFMLVWCFVNYQPHTTFVRIM